MSLSRKPTYARCVIRKRVLVCSPCFVVFVPSAVPKNRSTTPLHPAAACCAVAVRLPKTAPEGKPQHALAAVVPHACTGPTLLTRFPCSAWPFLHCQVLELLRGLVKVSSSVSRNYSTSHLSDIRGRGGGSANYEDLSFISAQFHAEVSGAAAGFGETGSCLACWLLLAGFRCLVLTVVAFVFDHLLCATLLFLFLFVHVEQSVSLVGGLGCVGVPRVFLACGS